VRKWIQQSPVAVGVGLAGLGVVLLFLGWNGAAGVDHVTGQVPYLISGGLTGLTLVAAGLTVVVVHSHRRQSAAVTDKLDELIDVVRGLGGGAAASGPTAVPSDHIVIAGRTTYHLSTCRLVAGRDDQQPMSPEAAAERGLSPCRICNPPAARKVS
jgi:hypothetical protein